MRIQFYRAARPAILLGGWIGRPASGGERFGVVLFLIIWTLTIYIRKKIAKPAGESIHWCRALRIDRCHYSGRFCNPAKIKEHPCPVAQKHL